MKNAYRHLQQDPVLAPIIAEIKITPPQSSPSLFRDLSESIINQQLSNKAAASIFGRFLGLFLDSEPDAKNLLSLSEEKLRSVGISRPKISYLRSLAEEISSGSLVLSDLQKLPDEDVIASLTRVKGIGRWTAEMFLIFSLARPDIFSVGDLGLCTAISRLYGIDRQDKNKIQEISSHWSPYRSLACLYLWHSLHSK